MTLLPYLTAADLSESDKKRIKPIEHPQPLREISIVHSKSQLKLGIIDILEAEIKKEIPNKLLKGEDNSVVSPIFKAKKKTA